MVITILLQALGRCIPGVGLYFSTLHFLSQFARKDPSNVEIVLMGAVARTSATVIVIPMTLLKTRFEVSLTVYSVIPHGVHIVCNFSFCAAEWRVQIWRTLPCAPTGKRERRLKRIYTRSSTHYSQRCAFLWIVLPLLHASENVCR